MSPLRRLWLAWVSWDLIAVWVSLVGMIVGVGVVMMYRFGLRDVHEFLTVVRDAFPSLAGRPTIGIVLVLYPLGYRLRQLVEADGLALVRDHTMWALRWLFTAILPPIALVFAATQIVTGIPPLWAVAAGAATSATGVWLGFSRGPAVLLAVLVCCALAVSLNLFTASAGWLGDLLAITMLLVVGLGARLAWKRLASKTVSAWSPQRWGRLYRLFAWLDACMMRQPAAVIASGRLPTLLTAARVGLSGLGGSWLLRLIGTVVMCIFAFAVISRELDTNDRLSVLMPFITVCALAFAPGWFIACTGEKPLASRGLLASQRLLPLPRRQAAAATMLSLIGNCLNSVLPLTGGMLLGWVLADAWQGRDSSGLWLILPQAVAVTVCSAAAMVLMSILPLAVAITGGAVLAVVLIMAPIVDLYDAYPAAPLTAAVLALVLVPLAWWRLAEVELP